MSFQQHSPGYVDQYGNWVSTGAVPRTTSGASPFYQPVQTDYRDSEINRLRQELMTKETSLKECYCEIGRLHEQLRGLTAFDKWSEGMTKRELPPAP